MSYDFILELNEMMVQGNGFAKGGQRMPLKPFKTADGQDVWNLLLDNTAWFQLKKDGRFQDLVAIVNDNVQD